MTSQLYYLPLWHKYFYCITVGSTGVILTSKPWFSLGRWEIGLRRKQRAEATEKSIHEWILPSLWLPRLQDSLRTAHVRTLVYPLPVEVKVQLSNFFLFFNPQLTAFIFAYLCFLNFMYFLIEVGLTILCKFQVYNIVIHRFKGYSPFVLIIKYWLYALCCIVYPCGLLASYY